jgi:hypothetical protein
MMTDRRPLEDILFTLMIFEKEASVALYCVCVIIVIIIDRQIEVVDRCSCSTDFNHTYYYYVGKISETVCWIISSQPVDALISSDLQQQ